MKMAHNTLRVDSMNDRYVTETMIDLNLDLNEEIDFDFFDNVETPTKESLTIEPHNPTDTSQSGSCSSQHLGNDDDDDDDVQISPNLLGHEMRVNKALLDTETVRDGNLSSDDFEDHFSTCTENEGRYIKDSQNDTLNKTADVVTITSDNMPMYKVTPSRTSLQKETLGLEEGFLQSETTFQKGTFSYEENKKLDNDILLKNGGDCCLITKSNEDDKNDASSRKPSLTQPLIMTNDNPNEDISSKSSSNNDDGTLIGENPDDKFSRKSSKSQKSEGSGSGYDSDEGCPFEGSDSDELLLGVHTLTIIPRETDEESFLEGPMICGQTETITQKEMIHSTSCEKAAITARSSSGYSSASCKAHGCMVSRGNTSNANSRQSSQMKVCTPDMDEFIQSFRKIHSTPPVSSIGTNKYSSLKKRSRRNMSFSNDELQRIERENAILLNKIVVQQRAKPTVIHKYERRITSNAINRARQLKKIENENEILLRKIQDVKRKSTLSAQNSRSTSQASASQF